MRTESGDKMMQLDREFETGFSVFEDTNTHILLSKLTLGEVEIKLYLCIWRGLVDRMKIYDSVFLWSCPPHS